MISLFSKSLQINSSFDCKRLLYGLVKNIDKNKITEYLKRPREVITREEQRSDTIGADFHLEKRKKCLSGFDIQDSLHSVTEDSSRKYGGIHQLHCIHLEKICRELYHPGNFGGTEDVIKK